MSKAKRGPKVQDHEAAAIEFSKVRVPTHKWIVVINGNPFGGDGGFDEARFRENPKGYAKKCRKEVDEFCVESEGDDYAYELAIVVAGSHGENSWGWFGPLKLCVSVSPRGCSSPVVSPELFRELLDLAHAHCGRLNSKSKLPEGYTAASLELEIRRNSRR